MTTWYDNTEDVLGIELEDGQYWKSVELENGIVIDISKDGKVTGLEVPRASKVFLGDAKKVIDGAAVLQ